MYLFDVLSESPAEGGLHIIREGVIAGGTALRIAMAHKVGRKSKPSHGETIILPGTSL
jgi:hypothetical protein